MVSIIGRANGGDGGTRTLINPIMHHSLRRRDQYIPQMDRALDTSLQAPELYLGGLEDCGCEVRQV